MFALNYEIVKRLNRWQSAVLGRKLLIVFSQVVLVAFAYYASLLLRFEFKLPQDIKQIVADTFFLVIAVKLIAFYCFGLIRGWWRYVGISDLLDITKAAFASSTILSVLLLFAFRF